MLRWSRAFATLSEYLVEEKRLKARRSRGYLEYLEWLLVGDSMCGLGVPQACGKVTGSTLAFSTRAVPVWGGLFSSNGHRSFSQDYVIVNGLPSAPL